MGERGAARRRACGLRVRRGGAWRNGFNGRGNAARRANLLMLGYSMYILCRVMLASRVVL